MRSLTYGTLPWATFQGPRSRGVAFAIIGGPAILRHGQRVCWDGAGVYGPDRTDTGVAIVYQGCALPYVMAHDPYVEILWDRCNDGCYDIEPANEASWVAINEPDWTAEQVNAALDRARASWRAR